MIRELCLLAALAAPIALSAQGAIPANQTPASQGNSTVAMPGTNVVYVAGGGLYGAGIYVAPGPTTQATNAGISLAGRAGISLNEPMQLGVQSTLAPSWPVSAANETGAYDAPEAAGAESGELASAVAANDYGPSYASDEPSAASFGEIAAYYKANRPQKVRTYTNADAQRLTGIVIMPGIKAGGASPPQVTTLPQPQASSEQQTVAANVAQSAPSAPEPQANPSAETHPGNTALPATSTLLPLLGLLGIASGGAGLWLRRRFLK